MKNITIHTKLWHKIQKVGNSIEYLDTQEKLVVELLKSNHILEATEKIVKARNNYYLRAELHSSEWRVFN